MAARTKRIVCDENTRKKIQTTQIIKRLTKHILAEPKINEDGEMVTEGLMTATQVTAALGIIRKTLPDLTAVDISGEVALTDERSISDSELFDIATSGSTGTTEPQDSQKELH